MSNNFEVKSNNKLVPKENKLPSVLTNEDKVSVKGKSVEKQIEEMAKVMCDDCASDVAPCRLNKEGKLCNDVVQQANALYNAGYRKQEWISVEDRLPEKNGQYLVTNGKKITIEQFSHPNCLTAFSKPSFCFWDNSGDGWWRKLNFPTHWMPLPEAPKMKGGREE